MELFFLLVFFSQDSKDAKAAKQAHLQAQIDRQKRQIRRKMGTVNYYLNCSARRRYVSQIVVVDPEEEEAKLVQAKQEEMAKAQTEQARASKAKQGKCCCSCELCVFGYMGYASNHEIFIKLSILHM